MGFGVLFFACFLTYFGALTPIGTFTFVLGAGLMLFALYKLSDLNKMFFASAIGAAVFLIVSMTVVIMSMFGMQFNTFYKVMELLQNYLSSALLLAIMASVFLVTKEVGLKKIQGWTIVNSFFILIYVVCDILSIFIVGDVATPRLGLVCIISQLLFSSFMLVILFNCYAKICYEDDKRMEKSATGMPVFDLLNKAFDKATDKNRKNKPKNKGGK